MGESKAQEMFEKYKIKASLLINSSKQFSDCRISEMEQLHDDEGNLMLFIIQMNALRNPTRKTWRSVGQPLQVSSEDFDLIETDYMAGGSPTESLLAKLKNYGKEPTVREFLKALTICGRHHVADLICNWPWAKYFAPIHSQ